MIDPMVEAVRVITDLVKTGRGFDGDSLSVATQRFAYALEQGEKFLRQALTDREAQGEKLAPLDCDVCSKCGKKAHTYEGLCYDCDTPPPAHSEKAERPGILYRYEIWKKSPKTGTSNPDFISPATDEVFEYTISLEADKGRVEWISVEDQLPDDIEKEYDVFCRGEVHNALWENDGIDGWGWNCDRHIHENVTHWKPKAEPPQALRQSGKGE